MPIKRILSRFAGLLALACLFTLAAHAAPNVTVTASSQSILGTTQTISLTVTLIDPNQTGMLKSGAVVVTNFSATSTSGTTVSVGPIYGNDVITDGFGNSNATYYKVQVFTVSNSIIASTPSLQNFYAFTGSGTVDLSTATPLAPSFMSGANGSVVVPGTFSVTGNMTGPFTFTGQINCKSISANIKCVDSANTPGWTGSDPGSWINAADTAIGAGVMGEIWYFGGGTETTQISLGDEHTLKIFNTLTITHPILTGKWSHLTCSLNGGSSVSTVCIVAANSMASMVRMRVQDGSLETFYFDHAQLGGGAFTFSRGMLDLTGVNDVGMIGDLVFTNFSGSSPAIYLDDCPAGVCAANAGSGHSVLGPIWITPNAGNTATGVLIKHTNTAGATPIGPLHFTWLEIQALGATLGGASGWFTVNNLCTATCGANQWQFLGGIEVDHLEIDNYGAVDATRFDGCMGCVIHNLYSFSGTGNLIHQTNSANNFGNSVENFFAMSGGVTVLDDLAAPAFTSGGGLVKNAHAWHGAPQSSNTGFNSWDMRYAYGNCIEQTAIPGGLGGTGLDAFWCDSVNHAWRTNINGSDGPAFNPTAAPDLGSTTSRNRIQTDGAQSTFRALTSSNGLAGWTIPLLIYSESGAPSAAASSDICYGDSTAHALRCSFNNSAFGPLVTAAPCTTSQKAESAADTNILTCTPVAQAGSYRIRLILSVSAANAATLGWTATWTDSNGAAQTPTNLALFQSGTAAPALTFTTSAAGNYYADANIDVNNAGTSIVIKLTFSGTSFAGKATATVERLI